MLVKINIFIFFILSFLSVTKSQDQDSLIAYNSEPSAFVSIHYGYQMSGIKSEDFVSSNYSPLFNITVGKWFLPFVAVQIGYKGFYFNYIEDDIKHYYNYFYSEALLNINHAINPNSASKKWNLLFHTGAGYFYNHTYGKPNICANLGIQNSYLITDRLQATIDISSIIGWDIYQGDEDILPGISFGIIYRFDYE